MKKTIYDNIKIQAIEDDLVINNANQRFRIYDIDGLDCYFHGAALNAAAQFLNKEGRQDTTIEFYMLSRIKDELLLSMLNNNPDAVISQRLRYLNELGVKSVRKFVALSSDPSSKKFPKEPIDDTYFNNFLSALNLSGSLLTDSQIKLLLYQICSLDDNLKISKSMTDREQLIQSQIEYAPDYFKIGRCYVKVLSLKDLPDSTYSFMTSHVLDFLLDDFLFTVSFKLLNQLTEKKALQLRGNIAQSNMQQMGSHRTNKDSIKKLQETENLEMELANTGHVISYLSSKIILWDNSLKNLERKTGYVIDIMKKTGFFYFEESYMHDIEFFRSLPSQSQYSNRQHKVLAQNFIEICPLSYTEKADIYEKYPLFVRNQFGELFGFDPGASIRNNWNTMIFGASGSGKSVTMNMLIAHAMYPRIAAEGGRIFIVDFAGAEKSSYLKMAHLFGGKFIPIDASGKIVINPFPAKSEVLKEGKWDNSLLTFVNIILDLILSNRDETMESDIYRSIISRAVRLMYEQTETPVLSDVIRFVDDDDKTRSETIKKLLKAFVDSPESKIISGKGNIDYGNEPFVIFDLQGISSLTDKMQQLLTFIVIQEAKKTAFRTRGFKFIIFDEVAQLIKDPRMVSLIDEMYSTARKYLTSITTITQNFLAYKEAALSSKIKINSTTTIFLSHARDEEAKRLVAQDFGFSDQELQAFYGLQTVKGQYSLALIRTATAHGEASQVIRIELSKLDYWIATSDENDNNILREIAKSNSCSIIEACYIAAAENV